LDKAAYDLRRGEQKNLKLKNRTGKSVKQFDFFLKFSSII